MLAPSPLTHHSYRVHQTAANGTAQLDFDPMPRKKDQVWDFFSPHPQCQYKYPRVKCNRCEATTAATVARMTSHMADCTAVQRSIGRLAESLNDSNGDAREKPNIIQQLNAKQYLSLSSEERHALDMRFAAALHKTCSDFSFFEDPAWRQFFDLLRVQWTPPTAEQLSNRLLGGCYQNVMWDMAESLHRAVAVTIGIDGATNVLSRSLSNVIAHDPKPWFVEYLSSDLKKETSVEVAKKVTAVVERLHGHVGKSVVFSFISDSCNVMRALRTCLLNNNVVAFAFGCSTHALNNLCEDIAKLASTSTTVRDAVFVSKSIKNQGLLHKIYAELCWQLFDQKHYAMVLYSASRWSSINFMFARLIKAKRAVTSIYNAVLYEKEEREIDESYELQPAFASLTVDPRFWQGVSKCGRIFDPICKCIGILEHTSATMATAYACFVAVSVHVSCAIGDAGERQWIMEKLRYRWDRIYTPVHALAFYCDPFYRQMRIRVGLVHSPTLLELDKGDIYSQCRLALRAICRSAPDSATAGEVAVQEFMQFCVHEEAITATWADVVNSPAQRVWTQAQGTFPALSALLLKVYAAPASTAGVERQHKVAKRVHTASRNRLAPSRVEQQAAIAHNATVASMELPCVRQPFEHVIIHAASSSKGFDYERGPDAPVQGLAGSEYEVTSDGLDMILLAMTDLELAEQADMSTSLASLASPVAIPNEVLYPYRDTE